MRQTELEKPVLYGIWRRSVSANSSLVSQSREIWVDGIEDPVATEYHLASSDGNFNDWVVLHPGYWSSGIKEKILAYLKATRPELFRKKRVRKARTPQLRDGNGKFVKKEKEVVQ